ncbi:patched domain-containing protein 3-like [Branchiostoma lanceolatum]|uniref:patched domain-containing protein 3-like n=1 Tax=Branchiostoma lanceolatum TaxID=7740 RepID=UPI003456ABFE
MIAKWIDAAFGRVFYNLGKTVARWPAPFILLPLLASALLGYFGLSTIVINDTYTFVPDDGQALPDGKALVAAGFSPPGDAVAELIVQSKDGGDVLFRDDVVQEVLRLHQELTTANTTSGETFSSLCFRDPATTDCVLSGVLRLMVTAGSGSALRTATNLSYPYYNPNRVDFNLGTYLGNELGGVELSTDKSTILSSKALHLVYNVNVTTLGQWIDTFRRVCSGFESDKITVNYLTVRSTDDEMATLPSRISVYIGVAVGLLILFSVLSCLMLDWVLTKPWLAVIGVLSAVLAIVSSIGVVLLAGESFSSLNETIPFLLLGIGVDDMFVMIAAWRKCDVRLPVQERTGRAMSDAGVSITITSITDCLAFAAGIWNVFPSVRLFCIYASVGVAFDFLYQITFFAAFMSLTGRRERANRHCLTCCPVLPKSQARDKSAAYRLCCAGGVSKQEGVFDNPSSEEFNKDPLLNRLLYNNLVPFILKPSSKVIIFILYAAYLGVAIWGCFQIRMGLEYQNVVADDSHVRGYYDAEETHFKTFGRKVDIFVTEPKEYWTLDVQQAVLDKLKAFDQSQYFYDTSETAEVWLRDFLRFLNQTGNSHAATNKTVFLHILISQFLPTVGRQYYGSVIFADNNTGIASSRFFVIPKDVTTSERGKLMMTEARSIAEREPLKMKAYSFDFFLSDQVVTILPSTLQTVGIAVAIMFVVCFLLIPHCVATFLITFALVSIDVGLVGYMTFWGINLDIVSIVSILMCIGFSVDFFAHITYAYVTSKATVPAEKLTEAMRAVGMPILQSSLSTILGMLVLAFFPAYIFRAFFKTIFLVMVFGAAHGLVILPILLTTLRPCGQGQDERDTVKKISKTTAFSNGGFPRPSYPRPHSVSPYIPGKTSAINGTKPTTSLPNLRPKVGQDNPYFTPEMREGIKWVGRQRTGIDNPVVVSDYP